MHFELESVQGLLQGKLEVLNYGCKRSEKVIPIQ